ncbi:hypothetical protein A9Q74_06905 [Colwellia sp. 39_35_sub15_T18]|nr:hypothetical protein A9Q74_06905 [Colwellia sp. 39_35_sub15_T18]
MFKVELSLDEDDRTVTMTVSLAKGKPLPKVNSLIKEFENSLYRHYAFNEDELSSSFELFSQTVPTDPEQPLPVFSCVIANAVDAEMEITFGTDDMSAAIELICAQGGQDITMKSLAKFLLDNDLKKGISQAGMKALVAYSKSSKKAEKITVDIAKGKEAITGEDGYIDYLVPNPIDRVLRPKKLDNGNVDMRDLGQLCFVKQGTKLAQLIPAGTGVNGFTVKGKELKAEEGKPAKLDESEGCKFKDEEQDIIIAEIDGMPKHLDESVSVTQIFNIDNVDVSTGNIEFDGSIVVEGNVGEAMKIIATGDVIVAGLVDSAFISAGGDICIAQSVIGHQKEDALEGFSNTVTLLADGNINANFIQYANIRAKGDINVVQYIAQSQVTLNGNLWVGKEGKADGKVFGCYVQAGKSIHVGTLGSPSSSTVSVDFNHLIDALAEVRQKIQAKAECTLEKTQKIGKLIAQIENKEIDRADLLTRLNAELKKYLPLLDKLNNMGCAHEKHLELHLNEIDVIVTHAILSGAEIVIADGILAFKREYGPSKIKYIENKVLLEPITQAE